MAKPLFDEIVARSPQSLGESDQNLNRASAEIAALAGRRQGR
jgi:hypothetical protein